MGFKLDQLHSRMESVNEFTDQIKSTWEEAKAALAKSKDDMTRYYNQGRVKSLEYKPGDKVYLDASNIHTNRPSRKLPHQHLVPFPIERKVGNNAYQLLLPAMKCLHPVFNVVKLTQASTDPFTRRHVLPPPIPKIIDGKRSGLLRRL